MYAQGCSEAHPVWLKKAAILNLGQQSGCAEGSGWGSSPWGITYRLRMGAHFCGCWGIETRRADPRPGGPKRGPEPSIDLMSKLCPYQALRTPRALLSPSPMPQLQQLPRVSGTGSDSGSQECSAIVSRPLRVGFGDPGGEAPLWLSFSGKPPP